MKELVVRLPFKIVKYSISQDIERRKQQAIKEIEEKSARIIRDHNVQLFCKVCGENIIYPKEPTVFGTKDKTKSGVYHLDCWSKS